MQLERTDIFLDWMDGLRDLRGRALVQARIERLAAGHPGDVKPVGDKSSQSADIVNARSLAQRL